MMPNATAKPAWSRVISTVNLTWALSEDLPILTQRPSFPLATATQDQDQDSQTLTFNSYHLCRALRHALPLKLNCCRKKKIVSGFSTHKCPCVPDHDAKADCHGGLQQRGEHRELDLGRLLHHAAHSSSDPRY